METIKTIIETCLAAGFYVALQLFFIYHTASLF